MVLNAHYLVAAATLRCMPSALLLPFDFQEVKPSILFLVLMSCGLLQFTLIHQLPSPTPTHAKIILPIDTSEVQLLLQAHAHNDYLHPQPLFDALAQGFTFIEADVHLIGDELYIAHCYPLNPAKRKTLKALYLEPLWQLYEQGDCRFLPGYNQSLYLMIDIKTSANPAYEKLKEQLTAYHSMLSNFDKDGKQEGAVTIFLSGRRPVKQVMEAPKTWVALDGRPQELEQGYCPHRMPLISERYSKLFGWGPFTDEVRGISRLTELARIAHAEGKKVRLWHSPEEEQCWNMLLNAGADLICTDELTRLATFLRSRQEPALVHSIIPHTTNRAE